MKIKAAQHIYGNVEIEKSPQKKYGFQTLFYTTVKITSSEILKIESRVIYYFSDKNPVKHAFFSLGDKVVVSRTVPRHEDEFSRCGLYFTHNLVFDKEEFIKISANPFAVFENFEFMESPDEAINKGGDFKTGNIEEIEIEIPDDKLKKIENSMIEKAKIWGDECKKLVHIINNSSSLTTEKKPLKIEAEKEEIENFLMAVFSLLSSKHRVDVSFDTYFYNCNPVRNYFTIIGIPPKQSFYISNYLSVDLNRKKIDYTIIGDADSIYLKWINQMIDGSNWEAILNDKEKVCEFENFINNKSYNKELLIAASDDLISTLVYFKREKWNIKVKKELIKQFGETIVNRVAPVILDDKIYKSGDLMESLLKEFNDCKIAKSEIAKILYKELLKDLNNINRSEFEDIEKFSEQNKDLIVVVYFLKKDDEFNEYFGEFDKKQYKEFAYPVIRDKPERMYDLLLPNKTEWFIEALISASQGDTRIEKNIKENTCPKAKNRIKEDFTENISNLITGTIIKNCELKEILTGVFEGFDSDFIAETLYEEILKNLNKISPSALKNIELLSKCLLFSWDDVPGNDSNRLIKFLKDDLKIEWVENAEIEKSDDGKVITVAKDENSIELELNEKENKVTLKISGVKTYEYILKEENGKMNVYLPKKADHKGLLAVVSFIRQDKNYQNYFYSLDENDCEKIIKSIIIKKSERIKDLMSDEKIDFISIVIKLSEKEQDAKIDFFVIIKILINKKDWKNLEKLKFSIEKLSPSQLNDIKCALKKNKDSSENAPEFIKKLDEISSGNKSSWLSDFGSRLGKFRN